MKITIHPLRQLGVMTLLFSLLLWSGCGDTFRPVVIPIPPTPPDPRTAHTALAITSNGNFNPGALMLIDVSGDSTSGVGNTGLAPSHVALVPPSAGHIVVANQMDSSLTVVSTSGLGPGLTAPTTITLSPNFNPAFLDTTENNVVYVANLGAPPLGVPPSVAVVSLTSNTVTNLITLSVPNPVWLAQTPDARKVYVASQGNTSSPLGGITSINTVDQSSTLISDPTGIINAPVAVLARSDSARVYVLNQGNGNVAVIDSSTSPSSDTFLPGTVSAGAGADFMTYDPHLNRLYITNSALGTLTILDATTDPPNLLIKPLPLPSGANPSCSLGCASVAALPDGTRAYVTTLRQSGSNVAALVTAINPANNTIVGSVSLPASPALANCAGARFRISSAASAESSRLYVANCDAGNVAVMHTSDNTLISLPAPVSAADHVTVNVTGATQNGSQTTFTYTLASGAGLQVGMSMVITGMANGAAADNGSFTIASLGLGAGATNCSTGTQQCTFTVLNPSGVSASAQSGLGIATPLQNPVFVLAGP